MLASIRFFKTIIEPFTNTVPGTCTPVWKLVLAIMELIILCILLHFIISDLKVIRWFENKKKDRLKNRFK